MTTPTGIDRLRLRHLRLLAQVAESGSLSAAAARLGLSQPAATNALHDLEQAFGVPLVQRGARGATLTPAGRLALERLGLALAQVDQAAATAGELPLIRLAVAPLVSVEVLPRLLEVLPPGTCRLHWREGSVRDMVAALAEHEVDAIVGAPAPADWPAETIGELVSTPLFDEVLAIVARRGHPLTRARRLPAARLAGSSWVLPTRGSQGRSWVEDICLTAGLRPPVPLVESDSFHANLTMVSTTDLLTVVPRTAMRRYRSFGLVAPLALAVQPRVGPVCFVVRRQSMALPALAALRTALLSSTAGQRV